MQNMQHWSCLASQWQRVIEYFKVLHRGKGLWCMCVCVCVGLKTTIGQCRTERGLTPPSQLVCEIEWRRKMAEDITATKRLRPSRLAHSVPASLPDPFCIGWPVQLGNSWPRPANGVNTLLMNHGIPRNWSEKSEIVASAASCKVSSNICNEVFQNWVWHWQCSGWGGIKLVGGRQALKRKWIPPMGE